MVAMVTSIIKDDLEGNDDFEELKNISEHSTFRISSSSKHTLTSCGLISSLVFQQLKPQDHLSVICSRTSICNSAIYCNMMTPGRQTLCPQTVILILPVFPTGLIYPLSRQLLTNHWTFSSCLVTASNPN